MKNHLILLLFTVLLFTECKQKNRTSYEDVASTNAMLEQYFEAATTGVISAADPLRFILKTAVTVLPENTDLKDLVTLNPAAEGITTLNNGVIITFTPTQALKPDQIYKVKIDLPKLDPKNYKKAIEYEVRTFRQDMSVDRDGFLINDDGSVSMLVGVQTADKVRPENLLRCFSTDADEKDIIEVGDRHYQLDFRYTNAMKKNSFIRYDGKDIYCEAQGSVSMFDVDTKKFGIVYTHFDSGQKDYNIYFSQKLNPKADYTGLITVMGNPAKFSIKNNLLTIHLGQDRQSERIKIQVSKSLTSESGQMLPSSYSFEVDNQVDLPSVQFVSDGHYFPTEGDFKIPVKTRALESVRIFVVEIKQENVKHFLAWQSLSYNDFYNIRMFGKPVFDQVVPLKKAAPDDEGWTVHGLDLTPRLRRNPGSIYHVSLGFGPQNTTLQCREDLKKYKISDNFPATELFTQRDYYGGYGGYYYDEYSWEERNNPCELSFYLDHYPVQKLFISSDFSIIAKKAGSDFHVALNRLMDLSAVSDAEVTLFDMQAEKLGSAKTDSKGFAEFSNLPYEPAVLQISKGSQITYLPLDPAEANSLTEFDVAGDRSEEDTQFFIYTDRDVWRPGDSIYLDVMINKSSGNLPAGLPLTVSFYNPDNLLLEEKIRPIDLNKNQIYSFSFTTATAAKTGVYRCMVNAGPLKMHKNIRIETIRPNTAETVFTFDNTVDNVIYSDKLSGTLKSQYLTGYAISGAKIFTFAKARKIAIPFPEFKDYNFDRGIFDKTMNFALAEVTTSENGSARVAPSDNLKRLNGVLNVSLDTETSLPGGGTNKEGRSIKVSPFQSYIGALRKPGTGWSGNHLPGENIEIELVNITDRGKLSTAVNTLTCRLEKNIEYWWVDKYRLRSNGMYYQDQYWENIKTESKPINGKTKLNYKGGTLSNGAYRVVIKDERSGHETELYFSVYDGKSSIPGSQPYVIEFDVEKDNYTTGEDIKIKLPEIKGAKALISIERGNKVVHKQWTDMEGGKQNISIKSSQDWFPNVYVHVTMIQPYRQIQNDLPLRMYGVRPVKMDGKSSQLKPVTNLPAKMESEKTYNFTVSESEGRPMEYTIAVVDEGLLSLTGFRTPDPYNHFNGKYPLLVKTWDLYKYLIQYFRGQFAGILSIGGDDAYNPDAIAEINRFKPVSIHMGPYRLESGKKNNHSITMPNYIGKVRVMIVACNDSNFGRAEQFIPVKNPLMIQTQFPRALNVTDRVQLPVTILRDDNSIQSATVKIAADQNLVKGLTPSTQVQFGGKDQVRKVFEMEVLNKTGQLDVNMEVTGGGKSMKEQTSLLIHYPNAYSSDVSYRILEPGDKYEWTPTPKGYPEVYHSTVTVSGLKVPNFTRYAAELIDYPYGCLEQTTSAGFGQLYLDKVLTLDPQENRKRLEHLQTAFLKLARMQQSSGVFNYWENNYYHAWSDIYAAYFLIEAQRENYLPQESDMVKKWIKVHTDIANKWALSQTTSKYVYDSESLTQAFRLFTLAKGSRPAKSAMNRFAGGNESRLPMVWWLMAGSYKLSGYDSKAKEMIRKAEDLQKSYNDISDYNSFGEPGRDLAIVVDVLSLFDDEKTRLGQYYDLMVDKINGSSWTSTQTKGYAFIAAYRFFGKSLGIGSKINYTANLTGSLVTYDQNAFEPRTFRIAKADTGKKTVIENKGKSRIYIIQSERFIDNNLYREAASENLGLTVSYSNNVATRSADNAKVGDNITMTVTVSNPNAFAVENLALNVKVPAGWELINPRIYETEQEGNEDNFDYQDFRDDRVYTFFSLSAGARQTYYFRAKAAFGGDYFRPAVSVEHMYKASFHARTAAQRVKVAE